MPLLDRAGRFKAHLTDWAVNTKQNGLPYFQGKFEIIAGIGEGGAWEDWRTYNYEINGFFYPIKKDGTPNTKTIDSLKAAIGWDGLSLESLQTGDYSRVVQIETDFEEYQGKQRLKVKWINPEDYEGQQVQKLEPQQLKSMSAKWGSVLRAVAPKAPTKPLGAAPKVPLAKPAAKTSAPPDLSIDESMVPEVHNKESAWAAFVEAMGDSENTRTEWTRVLKKFFPMKMENQFTIADWRKVEVEGPKEVIPI